MVLAGNLNCLRMVIIILSWARAIYFLSPRHQERVFILATSFPPPPFLTIELERGQPRCYSIYFNRGTVLTDKRKVANPDCNLLTDIRKVTNPDCNLLDTLKTSKLWMHCWVSRYAQKFICNKWTEKLAMAIIVMIQICRYHLPLP